MFWFIIAAVWVVLWLAQPSPNDKSVDTMPNWVRNGKPPKFLDINDY